MLTAMKRYPTETLESAPDNDVPKYRLLYTDHVPTSEWQVWYGSFEDVKAKAISRAKDDLKPSSRVFTNVFIIQRWDGICWDEYDEAGDDLTELAFGDDEASPFKSDNEEA